jgi:hypothetical protein
LPRKDLEKVYTRPGTVNVVIAERLRQALIISFHVLNQVVLVAITCFPLVKDAMQTKHLSDMETWYKQQAFFAEDKLDRIKCWMDIDYPKVIDLRDFKEAS